MKRMSIPRKSIPTRSGEGCPSWGVVVALPFRLNRSPDMGCREIWLPSLCFPGASDYVAANWNRRVKSLAVFGVIAWGYQIRGSFEVCALKLTMTGDGGISAWYVPHGSSHRKLFINSTGTGYVFGLCSRHIFYPNIECIFIIINRPLGHTAIL